MTVPGIVIATLRTLADQMTCEEDARILRETAEAVELDPTGELCCRVCQEAACDDGCPFEAIRAGLVA